jgi:DNA-binding response OmpR family regulator
VDSNAKAQEKIRHALEQEYVVLCVASVVDAKALLAKDAPDMVISEVVLDHGEGGLDLCRYVRSHESLHHVPIMLLTSLSTLQDKIAGFDAGTDDYVVKPFDARHLQARIRLLVRIKRLESRLNV